MEPVNQNLIVTKKTSSQSFVELAGYYADWDAEYRQLTPGHFYGSLHLVRTPSFCLINDTWDQAILVRGTLPSGVRIISSVTHQIPQRFRSRIVENGELITAPGGEAVDYQTHGACDALSFAIPEKLIEDYLQKTGRQPPWNNDPYIIQKNSVNKAIQTGRLWKRCILKLSEARHFSALRQQMIIDQALNDILDSITDETEKQAPQQSARKRLAIADQARAYLELHSDGPIPLAELCAEIGANERTLLMGFNELMGCSPGTFHRAVRYNKARQDLLDPMPGTTITDVATRWGFYHLGRFSTGYRTLFGETPSATLRR